VIEVRNLTKRYGDKLAVDHLSFTVHPGVVTGFLGPNGAGKSTTMRAILGLDHPSGGEALVNGRRYADHPAPLHVVGALLEARGVHPGRSAQEHLRALAATAGIGRRRVQELLELVGLGAVARQRVGGFSLGMGQRLGIASALLGDPEAVVLDEPGNGLDPDGIHWIRGLLRRLADEGRTVFVSSHLMGEMALTADQLVVIGGGRLLADVSMAQMTSSVAGWVRIRTPKADELRQLLSNSGTAAEQPEPDLLHVAGASPAELAGLAFAHGIVLHELTPVQTSLEDAYLAMTRDYTEYGTDTATSSRRAAA
jgi:ABC-2 type transport system ATP-binding protein